MSRPQQRSNLTSHVCVFAVATLAQAACAQDAFTSAEVFETLDDPPVLPGHRRAEPATPSGSSAEPSERHGLFDRDRLFGSWFGSRDALSKRGVEIAASYTLDWGANLAGTFGGRNSTHQLWDINTTFDLDQLAGIENATIFADAYFTRSYGGSSDIGDLHGVSNIDSGDNVAQLAELWYEHEFFEDSLRLKFGKIDGNSEFAFLEHSSVTLNGSISIPKTASDLPTFPEPATGVVCFFTPRDSWYFGAGIFDGLAAEGMRTGNRGPDQFFSDSLSSAWLMIAEAGMTWNAAAEDTPTGRFAIGAHLHTLERPSFDSGDDERATGVYALLEQRLFDASESDFSDTRGLYINAMTGIGNREVFEVVMQNMIGLVYHGPFESRPEDRAAFFASYLATNQDAGFSRDEYLFETLYSFALTPWMSVTPDVQYIVNPGGDQELADVVRAGIRIELTF
jgi:porin